MNVDIKSAAVFFGIGIVQGMILLDWYRDKQVANLSSGGTK